MLLAHIKDLVQTDQKIKYSFQLYEDMVEAWLVREEGIVEGIKKEPLRKFSECFAVDLFRHRKERGVERVQKEKLKEIAKQFNIPLDDWQLTGRSLLNRDAAGNYKFAHRSIMEYLFVRWFLQENPKKRFKIKWTDQMKKFLKEMLYNYQETNSVLPDLTDVDLDGVFFRNKPINLTFYEVQKLLKKHDVFESIWNKNGHCLNHQFEIKTIQGVKIVFGGAISLIWQQTGSPKCLNYDGAKQYIKHLNNKKFAGYEDWRLPTLEEAMTLMESHKKNANLYIDPVFDRKQNSIWTSDLYPSDSLAAWVLFFENGILDARYVFNTSYVRAVRSGQSFTE
ncbi:MAG TPA: DUF1566 domain-containing protein [bacterium]